MLGLIYINILKEINFNFDQPTLNRIKALPDIELFELDNFSDPLLFSYAQDFIDNHSEIILILKIDEGGSVLKITPILNKLLKKKNSRVFYNRGNDVLDKLLTPFEHAEEYDSDDYLMKKLLLLS